MYFTHLLEYWTRQWIISITYLNWFTLAVDRLFTRTRDVCFARHVNYAKTRSIAIMLINALRPYLYTGETNVTHDALSRHRVQSTLLPNKEITRARFRHGDFATTLETEKQMSHMRIIARGSRQLRTSRDAYFRHSKITTIIRVNTIHRDCYGEWRDVNHTIDFGSTVLIVIHVMIHMYLRGDPRISETRDRVKMWLSILAQAN